MALIRLPGEQAHNRVWHIEGEFCDCTERGTFVSLESGREFSAGETGHVHPLQRGLHLVCGEWVPVDEVRI